MFLHRLFIVVTTVNLQWVDGVHFKSVQELVVAVFRHEPIVSLAPWLGFVAFGMIAQGER
jgi:hypothetical protein